MATYRIKQAAELLGVSDDTVRRWAESGRLTTTTEGSRQVVDGAELAALAQELAGSGEHPSRTGRQASARNRFVGIVTRVVSDKVMAQVEIHAGPHRIVSLIRREAADELGLAPGVLAVAAVKSTNVVVELRTVIRRLAVVLAGLMVACSACGGPTPRLRRTARR